jgi:PucR C-terminal helix-turn-helix domain
MHGSRTGTKPPPIRKAALGAKESRAESASSGEFEFLCDALRAQIDSLAAASLERLGAGGPGWQSASFAPEQIAASCRAGMESQLRHFRLGALPERCPEDAAALLARFAKAAELEFLLKSYRCDQAVLWEAWFELVEDDRGLGAEGRRDLLARGSTFFFSYADLLTAYVADAYKRELKRLRGGSEPRRLRAIRCLLDGDPAGGSLLDFDLSRYHLGLIAWGEDSLGPARELAAHLRRPLFSASPPDHSGVCWAWLSGTRPLDFATERGLRCFEPSGGCLAIGLEAFGEDGFRATHHQALRARRFAREGGPPIVCYAEVALEALATENEQDARAFVAHELRGIEDDSPGSERLRETLAAYFAAEYNAASAAAALGVHQQTVANRLRSAEERLGGRSIGARRVEIEMALRLRASIGIE